MLDIEFYDGLRKGPPVLIAGGSFEQVAAASERADAINDALPNRPSMPVSPSTIRFYMDLAVNTGTENEAAEALGHYADKIVAGRRAFIERMRQESLVE